uniref:Uncharacterized protein n=1 Tax=Octopus bimaculoides TaxID=37653 RepID=A0A0L8I207_OCTBM
MEGHSRELISQKMLSYIIILHLMSITTRFVFHISFRILDLLFHSCMIGILFCKSKCFFFSLQYLRQ